MLTSLTSARVSLALSLYSGQTTSECSPSNGRRQQRPNSASAAAVTSAAAANTSASSSSSSAKPKAKTVDVSIGSVVAEGKASNEVFRILCTTEDRERISNVECLLPTLPRRKRRRSPAPNDASTKNALDERLKALKHQNELLHNRASFVRHQMASLHEMYETGLDIISRANDMRRVPDNCLPSIESKVDSHS